ncbi:hypothetical protein GGR44_000957 [Sphingobium fontiphilum]|uniref:Uncharacterized protein n=1 Tax=Sphingobium fontiphilum TaxID=944425 RepID=A0A7W6DDM3_9SPHN|nr:hypothetical protein [Sphingobium fontiphilum]MBB3981310.1 hypothetical protein [Sphingobium fontiphilum]
MSGEFTEKDRVELLAREWEYRHRTFWLSFNIWGALVGAAILGPFVKPDLIDIGWPILVVPLYGTGIALFASYHLASEAKRMVITFNGYKDSRGVPEWSAVASRSDRKFHLHSLSSAKVIANLFLYVLAPSCVSSALILAVRIYDSYGFYFSLETTGLLRGLVFLAAILAPVVGFMWGWRNTMMAMARKEREGESMRAGVVSAPGADISAKADHADEERINPHA